MSRDAGRAVPGQHCQNHPELPATGRIMFQDVEGLEEGARARPIAERYVCPDCARAMRRVWLSIQLDLSPRAGRDRPAPPMRNVTYAMVGGELDEGGELRCSECPDPIPLLLAEEIEGLFLTAHVHHGLAHPGARGWILLEPVESDRGAIVHTVPRVVDAP